MNQPRARGRHEDHGACDVADAGRSVREVAMAGQCREEVLEADRIGDEEECALRDHLLAVHPNTIQPETRSVLFRHFVVTGQPPPAA